MPDKIALEIVTPERRVLAEKVDEVVLPSLEGYMGILPGHAPLLAQLDVGEVSYRLGSNRHYMAISGGFAEVLRETVSVLARTCERPEEIDVERAMRSKAGAEKNLDLKSSEQAFRHAEVRLKRALCRIRVHDRIRH
jgi:F-type H+-transporting ATPase subunit epsilon